MKARKISKTDLELIEDFRRGNEGAFEELISRYEEKAYHLANRFTRNAEDAEEVLQDVFTTVYRKIDGFEGKASFSSWLYRVTVNAGLMKLRKRRQNRCVHLEDVLPEIDSSVLLKTPDHTNVDQEVFVGEMREALQNAVSELPDEYRFVYIMRDIDGLTSREVAELLSISVPAVKSRLHRARLMLRRTLAGIYRDANPAVDDRSVGNL
jgi:RNA polymerase sigma-70 factor (ECF subfamily)